MKIVSLNIWDLPLWFVRDRNARLQRIYDFFTYIKPDIVCFQESFDPDHRIELNAFFNERGYVSSDPEVGRRHILTVRMDTTGGLVVYSKFPIREIRFSLFPRSLFSPVEYLSGKGILMCVIETPAGPVQVANVHFYQKNMISDGMIHARQLNQTLDELAARPPLPTILAGDFNEDNIPGNVKFFKVITRHGFFYPYAGFADPSYRHDNPYVAIWINRIIRSKCIDYIFYKDIAGLGYAVEGYEMIYRDPPLSDHDPVMLTLGKK